MKNKIYDDFSKEKFNQNNNYNAIMYKVKEGKKMKRFKITNIAAVLLFAIIIGSITPMIYAKIQWNVEFKEYQNRPIGESKGSLDEARESDYAEILDMDFVKQDGISIKPNSILMTDDCFDANITFKFAEDKIVNSETFGFGYAVYDEDKNMYDVYSRMHIGDYEKYDNTVPFLYKELGIKCDKKEMYEKILSDISDCGVVEVNEEEKSLTAHITFRAKDTFPKSKKIYIRIFDLGYFMVDNESERKLANAENFKISDAEWIFEIELPEKFYERQTLELKLKDEIPELDVEKITLTELGLVLKFKSQPYFELIQAGKDMKDNFSNATKNMLNITDGEGKIYQELVSEMIKEDNFKITFDAVKKDLDKKLFINFTVNGQKYTSELIE